MSSQNENVRFHQNRNVLFFGGEDLKSCSNPVSRSPSSSEQHALRCGRVKLSTKRSSFDSLKAWVCPHSAENAPLRWRGHFYFGKKRTFLLWYNS